MLDDSLISMLYTRIIKIKHLILFENQIQTTSASPCRTQVQPAARFLVCSLIFIEYKIKKSEVGKKSNLFCDLYDSNFGVVFCHL